ncbi:MAG: hypothetical protein QW379_07905 [Thermoplasmata archaeon]
MGGRTTSQDAVFHWLEKLDREQVFEMFDAFVVHTVARAELKAKVCWESPSLRQLTATTSLTMETKGLRR